MRNARGASPYLFPQAACAAAPLCTFTDVPSLGVDFPSRPSLGFHICT